jgi:hypothetical protein
MGRLKSKMHPAIDLFSDQPGSNQIHIPKIKSSQGLEARVSEEILKERFF